MLSSFIALQVLEDSKITMSMIQASRYVAGIRCAADCYSSGCLLGGPHAAFPRAIRYEIMTSEMVYCHPVLQIYILVYHQLLAVLQV